VSGAGANTEGGGGKKNPLHFRESNRHSPVIRRVAWRDYTIIHLHDSRRLKRCDRWNRTKMTPEDQHVFDIRSIT